jgi:hypothetical protein
VAGASFVETQSKDEVYASFSATTVRDAPTTHGGPTTTCGRPSLHQPE